MPSIDSSIQDVVTQATEQVTRAAGQAAQVAADAMRAVEFSGMGVMLSDEAIKIVGAGSVSGQPIRTRDFKAAGSARVQGDLETDKAKVAGACTFEGNVRANEFRTSGSAEIAGGLDAHEIEASGTLHVAKDVNAQEIVTSGSFKVGGQVKAHEFTSSGSVRIEIELAAHEVNMELGGSSYVKSIRASEIRIRGTGGFFRARGELTSETIEGEDVYLEGTTADLVKGADVRIGPHCRIKVIEARELVVHESSEVHERRPISS